MANLARLCVALVVFGVLACSAASPLAAQTAVELERILASRSPESWTEITVDSTRDVGTDLSVAIEPWSGAPYLSYYESAPGDAWFARHVGAGGNCGPAGSWECQEFHNGTDVGADNAIAVYRSPAGEVSVSIAYYDATNQALIVSRAVCTDTCPFVVAPIQNGTEIAPAGTNTAVAYSPTGVPWISYQTRWALGNESVRVATFVGEGGNCGAAWEAGKWQCETIMSREGIGTDTAIAFDGSGRPHVAFYDPVAGYPYYAVRIGSGGNCGPDDTWMCRTSYINAHDSGKSIALFVAPDATPHLAYIDVTSNELVYATHVGTGGNCGFSSASMQWEWQCDVIDDAIGPVGDGRTVAIAGDPHNQPMIAYRDASSAQGAPKLMFAQPHQAAPAGSIPNCGPIDLFYTWVCTALDLGSDVQEEAAAVAIASNATGVAIAYHELDTYAFPAEGNLKVQWISLLLFNDGFESANVSRWSAHVP